MYKKILRLFLYFFSNVIYKLTFLFKTDKNIWLFGAWFGDKYSDNSKYLFEYLLKLKDDNIKVYWITKNKAIFKELKNKNIPVLYMYSVNGIMYTLKAGVIIMSTSYHDINKHFLINRKNKLRIQLWHGVGNKRIGFNTKEEFSGLKFFDLKTKIFPFFNNYDYDIVISTSDLTKKRFSTSFNIPLEKVPITGYPRNDIFFNKNPNLNNEFNILYAPTHRKQGKDNNVNYIPSVDILKKINKICKELKCNFLIKLHFYDENKIEKINLSNIKLIKGNNLDMQEILLKSNILITDYSSVYFDYLLLDKPVIFSTFDLEKYEKEDQGLHEPMEKIAAGPLCKNWNEVLESIEKFKKDSTLYAKERKIVKDRFHKYQDNKSCKRVYNEIIKLGL